MRVEVTSADQLAQIVRGTIRNGSRYIGYCPAHDDRKRSLSFSQSSSGKVLCMCFAGCSFGDIMSALGTSAMPGIECARAVEPDPFLEQKLEHEWLSAKQITAGCTTDTYLRSTRRLALCDLPDNLRHHPSLPYWAPSLVPDGPPERVGEFPAMVARIESVGGRLVGLHRTYLTESADKVDLGPDLPPRKVRGVAEGSTKGGAIRLYPEATVLGIAEGIETALAAHILTGLPVWATVTAVGMEALQLPAAVTEVVIFGDNDRSGRGQIAANKLASRLHAEGRKAKIMIPRTVGTDWADVLYQGENTK